jgi:hypothetical protein
MTGQSSSQAATPVQWWKPALFFLVVIIGLWYVKWQPYYGKAFTAAETHSIGKSILAQADASPLKAAWDYAMVYFLAVWKAAVLGVLLGSLIQVLIPRNWLVKTLGQPRFQGTLLGTIFSLPGMMCSCCAALWPQECAVSVSRWAVRWRSGWATRCSTRQRWCLWALCSAGILRLSAWLPGC